MTNAGLGIPVLMLVLTMMLRREARTARDKRVKDRSPRSQPPEDGRSAAGLSRIGR
jgi:hypothetical protein